MQYKVLLHQSMVLSISGEGCLHLHKIPCIKPHWCSPSPQWPPAHCEEGQTSDVATTDAASPVSAPLSWQNQGKHNHHGTHLLCSFCKWCNWGCLWQTRLHWGLRKRRVTFLKNIAYFTEFSSSLGFVICPEKSSPPFPSPDAWHYLQKSRKKSILQRMLSEDGKLAGETLPTHTELPQAFCQKRSRTHCFRYACHGEKTEMEAELHRNSSWNKLKTREHHPLNERWPVLMLQWIIIYFYSCTAE